MSDRDFKEILLATGNGHKYRLLRDVAREFEIDLISPADFLGSGRASSLPPVVEETGKTYLENASLKAKAYLQWSGITTLADDSGLEVDALKGAPGVNSARYGGEGLSDYERNERIIAELSGVPAKERCAKYCSQLFLLCPDGFAEEEVAIEYGMILLFQKEGGGFGYDPIFFKPYLLKAVSEMSYEDIRSFSFRAKAARELFSRLDRKGLLL